MSRAILRHRKHLKYKLKEISIVSNGYGEIGGNRLGNLMVKISDYRKYSCFRPIIEKTTMNIDFHNAPARSERYEKALVSFFDLREICGGKVLGINYSIETCALNVSGFFLFISVF